MKARIDYEDRTTGNGSAPNGAAASDVAEEAVRKWWPAIKWLGGAAVALCVAAAAGAWFMAERPTKSEVDRRIDERALSASEAKELVIDYSPYNADRATVQSIPEKLDELIRRLGAVEVRVGEVKSTVEQIEKRIERNERRRTP